MVGTRRRKHIVGGILVSAGLMIMGLAVTVLTLENNMNEEDDDNDE